MSNSGLVILSIKSMLSFKIQLYSLLLECKIKFKSFWLFCHIFWLIVTDSLKDFRAFILRIKQTKKSSLLGIA